MGPLSMGVLVPTKLVRRACTLVGWGGGHESHSDPRLYTLLRRGWPMTAGNHCRNARLMGDRLTPITANHILIVSQGERSAGQAAGSGENGEQEACQSRSNTPRHQGHRSGRAPSLSSNPWVVKEKRE